MRGAALYSRHFSAHPLRLSGLPLFLFSEQSHMHWAHPATHEKIALLSSAIIGVGVGIGIAFGF
jgi:hypothetical protein